MYGETLLRKEFGEDYSERDAWEGILVGKEVTRKQQRAQLKIGQIVQHV